MNYNKQSPDATAKITTECGTTWSLEYYMQTYISSNGKELFGIKVDKLCADGFIAETEETYAISDCPKKTTALLLYLANGTVPPCVLLEMVDEWFSVNEWTNEGHIE